MQHLKLPNFKIPDRIKLPDDLRLQVLEIEKKLSLISKSYSVHYVSPYENFLNLEGCLVTLSKGAIKDVTAFDHAHLTPVAASFFVEGNKQIFFAEKNH